MHAHGSTDPADLDEQFRELRLRGEHLPELVDHHEEIGKRLEILPGVPPAVVLRDVGQGPRRLEHPLTALEFPEHRVVKPVHQPVVVGLPQVLEIHLLK